MHADIKYRFNIRTIILVIMSGILFIRCLSQLFMYWPLIVKGPFLIYHYDIEHVLWLMLVSSALFVCAADILFEANIVNRIASLIGVISSIMCSYLLIFSNEKQNIDEIISSSTTITSELLSAGLDYFKANSTTTYWTTLIFFIIICLVLFVSTPFSKYFTPFRYVFNTLIFVLLGCEIPYICIGGGIHPRETKEQAGLTFLAIFLIVCFVQQIYTRKFYYPGIYDILKKADSEVDDVSDSLEKSPTSAIAGAIINYLILTILIIVCIYMIATRKIDSIMEVFKTFVYDDNYSPSVGYVFSEPRLIAFYSAMVAYIIAIMTPVLGSVVLTIFGIDKDSLTYKINDKLLALVLQVFAFIYFAQKIQDVIMNIGENLTIDPLDVIEGSPIETFYNFVDSHSVKNAVTAIDVIMLIFVFIVFILIVLFIVALFLLVCLLIAMLLPFYVLFLFLCMFAFYLVEKMGIAGNNMVMAIFLVIINTVINAVISRCFNVNNFETGFFVYNKEVKREDGTVVIEEDKEAIWRLKAPWAREELKLARQISFGIDNWQLYYRNEIVSGQNSDFFEFYMVNNENEEFDNIKFSIDKDSSRLIVDGDEINKLYFKDPKRTEDTYESQINTATNTTDDEDYKAKYIPPKKVVKDCSDWDIDDLTDYRWDIEPQNYEWDIEPQNYEWDIDFLDDYGRF